jgi:hypothetical protein
MGDPDFVVTTYFLDTLVAVMLREQHPEAFSEPPPKDEPSPFHRPALEILREYLRKLGEQLPYKQGEAQAISLETYMKYSRESFCGDPPLISDREIKRTVAAIRARH